MKRFAPWLILIVATCMTLAAYAGPLGKIRQAAQNTRNAAETATQRTAESVDANPADQHDAPQRFTRAIAVMLPTESNTAHGTVLFEQDADTIRVTASIAGLGAGTAHGFHLHEFGDISTPDGQGTGGHFNPDGHGHAGDLGNLQADDHGKATFTATFKDLPLYDGPRAIVGRGVVIHAQPNDAGQPTGNAGARIAQGVIGVARP